LLLRPDFANISVTQGSTIPKETARLAAHSDAVFAVIVIINA